MNLKKDSQSQGSDSEVCFEFSTSSPSSLEPGYQLLTTWQSEPGNVVLQAAVSGPAVYVVVTDRTIAWLQQHEQEPSAVCVTKEKLLNELDKIVFRKSNQKLLIFRYATLHNIT